MFNNKFLPFLMADGAGSGDSPDVGDPDKGSTSTENNNNSGEGQGATGNNNTGQEPSDLKFTQDDLNKIGASEHRKGVASAFKSLGFESEEEAKAFVEKYRQVEENNKDELTKSNEALEKANSKLAEVQAQLLLAEHRAKALEAGAPIDKVDDVVILAKAGVSEEIDFENSLGCVKTKYPALFNQSSSQGTGNSVGGNNGGAGAFERLGEKLAEQQFGNSPKSTYFNR